MSEVKPLLHTWSLSLEEQFYLIFPILTLIFWRFGSLGILIPLFLLFLLSFVTTIFSDVKTSNFHFFSPVTRAWELLAGVFVAFYLRKSPGFSSASTNNLLSFIGLLLIIFSMFMFDKSTPFPSMYTSIPVVGTVLIIIYAVERTWIHFLLSIGILRGLGIISFGTYLWHQPLLAFAFHTSIKPVSGIIIIYIFFLSLALAWLSWKFIENPFRNPNKVSSKRFLIIATTVSIFLIGTGLTMHLNDGFKNRIQFTLDSATLEASPLGEKCHSVTTPCEYFTGRTQFATFGDSHVSEISFALAEYFKESDISVQQNSHTSCKPNFSDVDSFCYYWSKITIARIVNEKRIQIVIVSYRLQSYLSNSQNPELIWTDLLSILNEFIKSEKTVFIIQPPELLHSIDKMAILKEEKKSKFVSVKRVDWDDKLSFVTKLHEVPKGVKILDPREIFCDLVFCYFGDSVAIFTLIKTIYLCMVPIFCEKYAFRS